MSLRIKANGWRYETLGVSELLHYQGTMNFDARTEAQITTSPPMFYDRVLSAVFIIDFSSTSQARPACFPSTFPIRSKIRLLA